MTTGDKMKIYEKQQFDEERAFYGEQNILLRACRIDGPLDGESAFKEARDVELNDCFLNLRYPLWHCDGVKISNSEMTELCRAALWYSNDINIEDSRLGGIKAVRECNGVKLVGCDVFSPEFGWFSSDITVRNSSFVGEYFMLRAKKLDFSDVRFSGKYSFQYIEDSVFENCVFDTKDAFWHAKNVTVRNCTVKGEYLAWYAENITFENCHIIGTQPLCYCKNLRLIDCTMTACDLSFEKSSVEASISGHVDSIKNPAAGEILVDSVGEIIMDDESARGEIIISSCSSNRRNEYARR